MTILSSKGRVYIDRNGKVVEENRICFQERIGKMRFRVDKWCLVN